MKLEQMEQVIEACLPVDIGRRIEQKNLTHQEALDEMIVWFFCFGEAIEIEETYGVTDIAEMIRDGIPMKTILSCRIYFEEIDDDDAFDLCKEIVEFYYRPDQYIGKE